MAGTIYEGIRYVLFSNLLILSTIKVYKLIISVPKPSLQSFLSVTPTTIKILHKHTHVYTSIASFVKAGRIAKHYKAAVCISTNSFTLNFFTLQSLLLNPTPIHFQFPPHKTPNNESSRSRFVWCDVPTVNLEYTIREET